MIRTTALAALVACLPLFAAENGEHPKPPKGDGEGADHRKEMLDKYDTNKDGKLDDSERKAMRDARTAELKTAHPKLFAALDTDGDGTLSEEETRTAMEALRGIAPPPARRQGPPEGK